MHQVHPRRAAAAAHGRVHALDAEPELTPAGLELVGGVGRAGWERPDERARWRRPRGGRCALILCTTMNLHDGTRGHLPLHQRRPRILRPTQSLLDESRFQKRDSSARRRRRALSRPSPDHWWIAAVRRPPAARRNLMQTTAQEQPLEA